MKPISKCISCGFSKSVQLFIEDEEKYSKVFVVVISERYTSGDLRNVAEYRYKDYVKAVRHFELVVVNFYFGDLYQK